MEYEEENKNDFIYNQYDKVDHEGPKRDYRIENNGQSCRIKYKLHDHRDHRCEIQFSCTSNNFCF